MTTTQLLRDLAQFTGSTRFWRHCLTRDFYWTEGINYLAEEAQCYWLIDTIAFYQRLCRREMKGNKPLAYFQLWILSVSNLEGQREHPFLEPQDSQAVLTCWRDTPTSGQTPAIADTTIAVTDFPLPEIKLYVTGDTLMLPGEY